MSTETTPPGALFDRLIEAMPSIAEAVNAFTLEDNQRIALQALLTAAGSPASPPAAPEVRTPLAAVPPLSATDAPVEEGPEALQVVAETSAVAAEAPRTAPETKASTTRRVRKTAAKRTYPRSKDMNFRPEGKVSLRDFWAQKEPGNNHERNLVVVHYLEEVLEVGAIEVGHVLAGYDEVGVKSPAIPDNSLMVTASQKGWLDTSDMKAIRTTHGGRNAIQYDMPVKKAKKSA